MPEGRPSYCHSTTSQILVCAVVSYLSFCAWLAAKGQVSEAVAGAKWLVETALVLYGYRKGVEAGKNGKQSHDPPPPSPA